ncbi:hypothetical protein LIER_12970 [Lithospermum erythrorhizon]|uniref:Gag-pol polyprotein n=1 Tax=Lithospermum erythrorhizon TaxID=34254 RepID=A0AAV3PVV4_LITER
MNNKKMVRKVLRTLPKRFAHKVTAIEEAQDLTTMRLDEGDHNETNFVAFTIQIQTSITVNPPLNNCDTDPASDDEGELIEEELVSNYQMLFDKWSELTQGYTSKEAERSELLRENLDLCKIVEKQGN